jgi:hypothetical protein
VYRSSIAGTTCWIHEGFWGVQALTCPELDITITRSWNQAATEPAFDSSVLATKVVAALGIDPAAAAAEATSAQSATLIQHPITTTDEACPDSLGDPALQASCGVATVPLDWSAPTAGTIEVWFATLPAADGSTDRTLVPMLGGPGGAISTALDSFVPLHELAPSMSMLFVDVRGVGRSSRLACPEIDDVGVTFGAAQRQANAACAATVGERRNLFTTASTALDIEAIRRHLELGQPSLLAFSYGTLLASTLSP